MKQFLKELLFAFMLLLLIGCSKDDDNDECTCDLSIIVVDGDVGIEGRYFINKVPCDLDWNTYKSENNIPDNHWLDNRDCD